MVFFEDRFEFLTDCDFHECLDIFDAFLENSHFDIQEFFEVSEELIEI